MALLLVARPAAAGRRYNWELAVVDGAAAVAIGGGLAAKNHPGDALAVAGGLTYFFGAPILHAAHGNKVRGVGSFGARVLAPIIGGAIAVELADDPETISEDLAELMLGVGAGAVVAAGVDIAIPARDTTVVVTPAPGGGAVIGLAGTF